MLSAVGPMQASTIPAPSCSPVQEPSLPPNHHLIQQKRIDRLQEQLKDQRQQTEEIHSHKNALIEEVQMLKEGQKGATHRQFQAGMIDASRKPCDTHRD